MKLSFQALKTSKTSILVSKNSLMRPGCVDKKPHQCRINAA
jgi:hypothetical protein